MENVIITTQVKGLSFKGPESTLRPTMVLSVSWEDHKATFINEGVVNKTVFEKLKYMIISLNDCKKCCDIEKHICGDFRTGIEQKYISGKISDKTVEFMFQIAK